MKPPSKLKIENAILSALGTELKRLQMNETLAAKHGQWSLASNCSLMRAQTDYLHGVVIGAVQKAFSFLDGESPTQPSGKN